MKTDFTDFKKENSLSKADRILCVIVETLTLLFIITLVLNIVFFSGLPWYKSTFLCVFLLFSVGKECSSVIKTVIKISKMKGETDDKG